MYGSNPYGTSEYGGLISSTLKKVEILELESLISMEIELDSICTES